MTAVRLTLQIGVSVAALLLCGCGGLGLQEDSLRADLILEGRVESTGELEYMFGDVGLAWYGYTVRTSGEHTRQIEFVSDRQICSGSADPNQRYLVLLHKGSFYVNQKKTQLFVAVRCLPSP